MTTDSNEISVNDINGAPQVPAQTQPSPSPSPAPAILVAQIPSLQEEQGQNRRIVRERRRAEAATAALFLSDDNKENMDPWLGAFYDSDYDYEFDFEFEYKDYDDHAHDYIRALSNPASPSPLPYWYPRLPLQDITAAIQQTEGRKNLTKQKLKLSKMGPPVCTISAPVLRRNFR